MKDFSVNLSGQFPLAVPKILFKKLFSKIVLLPFDFQASTWWSVNLIALYKILLVRIVIALGNKPHHFKGLEILIGKLTRISFAI